MSYLLFLESVWLCVRQFQFAVIWMRLQKRQSAVSAELKSGKQTQSAVTLLTAVCLSISLAFVVTANFTEQDKTVLRSRIPVLRQFRQSLLHFAFDQCLCFVCDFIFVLKELFLENAFLWKLCRPRWEDQYLQTAFDWCLHLKCSLLNTLYLVWLWYAGTRLLGIIDNPPKKFQP